MKYIVFILLMAVCVCVYMKHGQIESNLNLNQAKNEAIHNMSKEKTIFGVNNARNKTNEDTERALNNY